MGVVATFVIPAHNREKTIDRTIGSIANSGMVTDKGSYEIIVVDDFSVDNTFEIIRKWTKRYPTHIIGIRLKEHCERVIATNVGILKARGNWIVRLDSDDEMATHFKKAFEDAIEMNPTASILNWGSVIHHRNRDGKYTGSTVRNPFVTTLNEDRKVEPFKSGGICSGGFAFKKNLVFRVGFLPEARNPYTFGQKAKREYPDIAKLYGDKDDLGNPWGDDYVLYYKITRVAVPTTINHLLHIQHVRV
jgi:glycosyltransferase involved in cell wall biosynthesis